MAAARRRAAAPSRAAVDAQLLELLAAFLGLVVGAHRVIFACPASGVDGKPREKLLYACPVFFAEVTPLMRQGLRLKKAERPPAMRVTVTILESDRERNNSKRNLVEASLYVGFGSTQMAGRGHMTDPVLLPHKGPGFLMAGTEMHAETVDGAIRVHEHRQLVVPVERGPGQ